MALKDGLKDIIIPSFKDLINNLEDFSNSIKNIPMVALATAHPAKFPEAVEDATGAHPNLPSHLKDLMERPEQFDKQPNDLQTVQNYIKEIVK